MNSVTKGFTSGRGGKRNPGDGKKLGRPEGRKSKTVRLPVDIADKVKKNINIIDAMFPDEENESDSYAEQNESEPCHKKRKSFISGRGGKRIAGPGKKVGRPEGEKTKVVRLPVAIADKVKENVEMVQTIFCNGQNGFDSYHKKLNALSEMIEKWNDIIGKSDNPNHPDLKMAKEMLTELNEALKKA